MTLQAQSLVCDDWSLCQSMSFYDRCVSLSEALSVGVTYTPLLLE